MKKTDSGGVGDAGQMSVDALRRKLVKESIIQEIIAAELAEQRGLESEVRRELGLEHAGPLSLCAPAGLQLTTLPQHDTSPVRQEGLLHLHVPRGMPVPRRSVKDRIDEWYRPPWHRLSANEDALMEWVSLFSSSFFPQSVIYMHVKNIEMLHCSRLVYPFTKCCICTLKIISSALAFSKRTHQS
jgi:hypothetical protein